MQLKCENRNSFYKNSKFFSIILLDKQLMNKGNPKYLENAQKLSFVRVSSPELHLLI